MTMMKAIFMLDNLIDESDPDVSRTLLGSNMLVTHETAVSSSKGVKHHFVDVHNIMSFDYL